MRRAKIVCTIGPASRSPDVLRALVVAGMDVARLNFSHGSHADHAAVVADLRRIADEAGRPLAILQDLQGPKIRLGTLQGGAVRLVPAQVEERGQGGALLRTSKIDRRELRGEGS